MLNPLPIVYALEMKKTSRAPYGARGLKWEQIESRLQATAGRAPYGARGLKYRTSYSSAVSTPVAPRMGRVD